MQVGSLVECIDNHIMKGSNLCMLEVGYKFPIKNRIYTVRGFNNSSGIWLEEIINPVVITTIGVVEVAFGMWAFREIQPPMTINIEEIMHENT